MTTDSAEELGNDPLVESLTPEEKESDEAI